MIRFQMSPALHYDVINGSLALTFLIPTWGRDPAPFHIAHHDGVQPTQHVVV